MAEIFYCGGSSGRLGESFPELNPDCSAHTVIEIARQEEHGSWKAGFYLLEKAPASL